MAFPGVNAGKGTRLSADDYEDADIYTSRAESPALTHADDPVDQVTQTALAPSDPTASSKKQNQSNIKSVDKTKNKRNMKVLEIISVQR